MKRIPIVFVVLTILFCCSIGGFAKTATAITSFEKDYETVISNTIQWAKYKENGFVLTSDFLTDIGSSECDFAALALARYGYPDNGKEYLTKGEAYVIEEYKKSGKLHNTKATEYQRFALGLSAVGGNPLSFGGQNLIADGTYQCLLGAPWQNRNILGAIWGLLALNSLEYSVPQNAAYSKEAMIGAILAKQHTNGGFILSRETADAEATALAITALAPYYNDISQAKVKIAIDKGLSYLSSIQKQNGAFESGEITAEVVIALCALNRNPLTDPEFMKSGNSLFGGLSYFYRSSDGSFSSMEGGASVVSATNRCRLALVAYYRYSHGYRFLYDLREEPNQSQSAIDALIASIQALPATVDFSTANQYFTVARQFYMLNQNDKNKVTNSAKLLQGFEKLYVLQKALEPGYIDSNIPENPKEEPPKQEGSSPAVTPDKPTETPKNNTTSQKKTTKSATKTGGSRQGGNQGKNVASPTNTKTTPGSTVTVSNTKHYTLADFPTGIVPKSVFEGIRGKAENIVFTGNTQSGVGYSITFHGADIVNPSDFDMRVSEQSIHEKEILSLSENPLILGFANQKLPGEALFEISNTSLANGETLLFSYDSEKKQAVFQEKILVENGAFSFILTQCQTYFVADRAKAGVVGGGVATTGQSDGGAIDNPLLSSTFWYSLLGSVIGVGLIFAGLWWRLPKFRVAVLCFLLKVKSLALKAGHRLSVFYKFLREKFLRGKMWLENHLWQLTHKKYMNSYRSGEKL